MKNELLQRSEPFGQNKMNGLALGVYPANKSIHSRHHQFLALIINDKNGIHCMGNKSYYLPQLPVILVKRQVPHHRIQIIFIKKAFFFNQYNRREAYGF